MPEVSNMAASIPGEDLRGKDTLNPNLACFVHYLKIINIFWKNNVSILKQKSYVHIDFYRFIKKVMCTYNFLGISALVVYTIIKFLKKYGMANYSAHFHQKFTQEK